MISVEELVFNKITAFRSLIVESGIPELLETIGIEAYSVHNNFSSHHNDSYASARIGFVIGRGGDAGGEYSKSLRWTIAIEMNKDASPITGVKQPRILARSSASAANTPWRREVGYSASYKDVHPRYSTAQILLQK